MNLQFTTTKDAKTFVAAKMQEVLRDFGVTTIVPWTTRVSDLDKTFHLDSLDQVELIMCLEDELEMELSDEALEKCATVDEILAVCIQDYKIAIPDVVAVVPPVTTTSTVPPYKNDIGILLLPSLEEHGRIIQITSVSINEALELVDQFTKKVRTCRKIKEYQTFSDDNISNMQIFSNILNCDEMHEIYVQDPKYLDADLAALFESKIPKYRGLRPIFVSKTVIAVGTTVIYNPNWATVNFEDYSILGTLQKIQTRYQKLEDDEDDDSSYSSSDSSF